jgi:phenylacetate-CoA ligase
VAAGSEGELVLTTLTKEALPLIRYRTGDLVSITSDPCECGRTTVRLMELRGRRDDMLIVRGVNVFPSQVEHVLLSVDGVAPHYRLIVERTGAMDELTLECEPAPGAEADDLAARVGNQLREQMGIRFEIVVCEPGTIPRSEGKAVRVVDRR